MSDRFTSDVTKDWVRAANALEYAEQQLKLAKIDLAKFSDELGAIIAPSDMEMGEVVCVWHRIDNLDERCFQAKKKTLDGYEITLRGSSRKVDDQER